MSSEENAAKMLAIIEKENSITLDGITTENLWDYTKQQIKDTYVKPRRLSNRREDPKNELYTIPLGVFNLGNNSMYYKKLEPKKEEELLDVKEFDEEGNEIENDVAEVKNYTKMIDGKLVFVEDEQGNVDAEEELLKYNLEAKNDLPFQIYRKILYFGRLTLEELYSMYGAVRKEMFLIIVRDMVNKGFLKKVKEKDQIVEFNDDAKTLEEFTKITEKEIETLEVTDIDERRKVLEEKTNEGT